MNILIGPSYYLRFDPKLWAAMQPYPPLGTLYAASVLQEEGHDVALFDATLARSEAEWKEQLDLRQPGLAVIYEDNFNYLSKMCLVRMREAAFRMIAYARERGIPVVVSGSDPADHAGDYLAQGADFIIIGEGEQTLRELVSWWDDREGNEPEDIPGLAFLKNGEVFKTRPRNNLRDLDELPFPARDLADIERYRQIWLKHHGYFSLNMVTTRGCPFHCNWCAKPIWGQRYNARSPANVVAEMKLLKEQYRADHFWFMDDIMGLKPGWLEDFASQTVEAGIRRPFKCLNRPDLLLRDGVVPSMARAGCSELWMGVESGSQKILDAMEKGTRVEQIDEATRLLKKHGIRVAYFLQFGYPGETTEDIDLTRELIHRNRPDDIGISVSYPLPGTKFHESIREQLGNKMNWYDSNDLAMMYEGPYSTAFYRKLHSLIHNEFYLLLHHHLMYRPVSWVNPPNWRKLAGCVKRKLQVPFDRRALHRLAGTSNGKFTAPQDRLSQIEAATPDSGKL